MKKKLLTFCAIHTPVVFFFKLVFWSILKEKSHTIFNWPFQMKLCSLFTCKGTEQLTIKIKLLSEYIVWGFFHIDASCDCLFKFRSLLAQFYFKSYSLFIITVISDYDMHFHKRPRKPFNTLSMNYFFFYRNGWILISNSDICVHCSINRLSSDNVSVIISCTMESPLPQIVATKSTIMMSDISKMKGPNQFLWWEACCHLEIFRGYCGDNSDFWNMKLPADTATNVEIIGAKRSAILLIMKHAITHMLTWEKNIAWLPISPIFSTEAFTQMNIFVLNSHRKPQVL